MSVGNQNFSANSILSWSEHGQTLFIQLFTAIFTFSSQIMGIWRLHRGIIAFFQICLLYLLSFGCTSNATSPQHESISSTYTGNASHFAHTKYFNMKYGIFSSFRSMFSKGIDVCKLKDQYHILVSFLIFQLFHNEWDCSNI